MKKLLWGLFSLFLCVAFVSPVSALVLEASDVWEETAGGNGHEYRIFYFQNDESKKWEDAKTALKGSGFTLAAITTKYEQAFVQGFLRDYANKSKRDLWVGGFQDPNEATAGAGWQWVTKEDWIYTSWIGNEANDYYDTDDREAFENSEMYLSLRSGNFDWNWNDEGNLGNISGYLAETAPVPEPGTIVLMGLGLVGLAGVGRKKFRK